MYPFNVVITVVDLDYMLEIVFSRFCYCKGHLLCNFSLSRLYSGKKSFHSLTFSSENQAAVLRRSLMACDSLCKRNTGVLSLILLSTYPYGLMNTYGTFSHNWVQFLRLPLFRVWPLGGSWIVWFIMLTFGQHCMAMYIWSTYSISWATSFRKSYIDESNLKEN